MILHKMQIGKYEYYKITSIYNNNCYEFLASGGVNLHKVHQSLLCIQNYYHFHAYCHKIKFSQFTETKVEMLLLQKDDVAFSS